MRPWPARTSILIVILAMAACSRPPQTSELSGVVEARLANVASRVGGRVVEVVAEEGQVLDAGQVIVRLEAKELLTERAQLEARRRQAEAAVARLSRGYRPEEIEQARANAAREEAVLEALRNGPRPQEIDQAQAELAAARAEAVNAQTIAERLEKLRATGDVSQQSGDDARTRRDAARERVTAIEQRLAMLRAGTRREEIAAAEARLAQSRANAEMLRSGFRTEDLAEARARLAEIDALLKTNAERIAEMEVRAPGAPGSKARLDTLSVRPGDVVAANRVVASLLEPSQVWVRAYVPEPRLGSVKVGQAARLRVDAFPGKTFSGTVAQIASQSEFLPRNIQTREDRDYQVFAIRVRPNESLDVFKPGMAASVELQ